RYGPNPEFKGRPYYWANQADTWQGTTHRDNTLRRWAADLQNDFRARLDWCVKPFQEANHPPVVVINGQDGKDILHLSAEPGATLMLDATGSSDPDGQKLTHEWVIYPEAGTYPGALKITGGGAAKASLIVPGDAGGKTVHIILAVRDQGTPLLARYRRVVVNCTAPTQAASPQPAPASASKRSLRSFAGQGMPDLFVRTDTCNVYVLRDGDAALLIDLGDGSVLDQLADIGVKRVEWVLFTHHHREQCQGHPRLKKWNAKVGAPDAERAFFERPADFRKMKARLYDPFTVYGSSFVRPPIQPIPVDRAFEKMDTFEWRGHSFWCLDTRGHSPGGMSYLLRRGPRWLAFTGDLMLEDARLHTWFDSEWDYGFGSGIWALANAAGQVAGFEPEWLLPSHGAPIPKPAAELERFRKKLVAFERLYLRGYPVHTFSSAIQDKVSRPTVAPHVWQVLPHVFKLRGPNYFPNFYLIMAPSGRGLIVDGMGDTKALDEALKGMQQRLGLTGIDAVIPTHMHGDHTIGVPHLREKWGAQVWALDRMAAVLERPEAFDYLAPSPAYNTGVESIRLDRVFKDGETFEWEGYKFTIDWMPGQTEFALALRGTIDGRKVVFTGDNIFGDPDDPTQNGHEAVASRCSAIFEEGYIYGGEYLSRIKPDIILGAHSYVMDNPAAFIERYRQWAYQMRDAFRELIAGEDYRYGFDPFWVRAEPYRATVKPGESVEVRVHVRNFLDRAQTHRIEIHAPPGLVVEPAVLEGKLGKEARQSFPIRVRASADAASGVNIVAFDITLGTHRYGEWFDFIVQVGP
ncbi:MAG: MBL fold metallo-hydrolase, partial [Burkholderiales bacterium]